jgi:hypothetical protein
MPCQMLLQLKGIRLLSPMPELTWRFVKTKPSPCKPLPQVAKRHEIIYLDPGQHHRQPNNCNACYNYFIHGRSHRPLRLISAYDSVQVVVNPNPNAHFTWNPIEPILMLTPDVTFNNPNVIPVTRQWDFGDGTSSTEDSPAHAFEKKGTYTVQLYATSDKGCKSTHAALLNIKDVNIFYIPNSFTPNGDGINDKFEFFFNDSIPLASRYLTVGRNGVQWYRTKRFLGWHGCFQWKPGA